MRSNLLSLFFFLDLALMAESCVTPTAENRSFPQKFEARQNLCLEFRSHRTCMIGVLTRNQSAFHLVVLEPIILSEVMVANISSQGQIEVQKNALTVGAFKIDPQIILQTIRGLYARDAAAPMELLISLDHDRHFKVRVDWRDWVSPGLCSLPVVMDLDFSANRVDAPRLTIETEEVTCD